MSASAIAEPDVAPVTFKEYSRPDHSIEDIVSSPFQTRQGFDQTKLEELAQSIREHGIIQPLVLRMVSGNRYELVAGERRWRAAQIAGLATVPVVVKPLTDLQAAKIVIIENDQREDTTALERARGYARLMELDPTYRDRQTLADTLGKSLSWVHNAMKLLEIVPSVEKALGAGSISEWHAIAIARLQPIDQLRALKACTLREYHNVPGGSTMSVRALKEWIAQNIHMDLDKAPFPAEDATLLPAAGVCSACPKRAGANAALVEAAKANTCTDRACYEAKTQAHVARRLELLSVDGKAAVRVVHPFYLDVADKKRLAAGAGPVLTKDQYRPAGAKVCPHTHPAVLLDVDSGAIKQELTVCTAPVKCSVHADRYDRPHAPTKSEKAAAEKRKAVDRKRRETAAARRELLDGLRGVVTELRIDDLRLVALQFLHKLDSGKVHKLMGWPTPEKTKQSYGGMSIDFKKDITARLAKASPTDLASFLMVCALQSCVDVEKDYFKPDIAPLHDAAKRWKVVDTIAKAKAAPGPKVLRVDAATLERFAKACCAGVRDNGRVHPVLHDGLLYAVTGAIYQGGGPIGCSMRRLYDRQVSPLSETPFTVAQLQKRRAAKPGAVVDIVGLLVTGQGHEYVLGPDVEATRVETSPRKTTAKKKR